MTVIELAGRTPAQKQGLLSQLVVPRPIAMITSLDSTGGLNLAPFSYFMPVCGEPPTIACVRLRPNRRTRGSIFATVANSLST
jgi:flavin reductase (DIM6/NTAB) family NADH-FMN oxidoreductase RutF